MPFAHIPRNLVQTSPTNSALDGILWGWHWGETNWGFSFPTGSAEFTSVNPGNSNGYLGYDYESVTGFQAFNALQQSQIVAAVESLEGFIPVNFKDSAVLGQDAPVVFRFAIADSIDYGYGINGLGETYAAHGPGGGRSAEAAVPDPFQLNWRAAGDTWYIRNAYDAPIPGSFANAAGLLHEFGHALGLKHGHAEQPIYVQANRFVDANGNAFAEPTVGRTAPKLPTQFDSQEFSIMTYKLYVGDDQTSFDPSVDITRPDYPWSWMMLDIAALQYLYGANFGAGSNPGDTVYRFNTSGQMTTTDTRDGNLTTPASQNARILTTIWDGGGIDTYDFSNYTNNQVIDLRPGEWSNFSTSQLAHLGVQVFARGNIANAMQFGNDLRSRIENANGGSGNDVLIGNSADNRLNGGRGGDSMTGLGGNDTYIVDSVGDIVVELAGGGNDTILTTISYTMVATSEIENLRVLSAATTNAINLTGNNFVNTIIGNNGANRIDGKGGADRMFGYGGNDVYFVERTTDQVFEGLNGGVDAIYSAGNYSLAATSHVEQLWTTNSAGTAAINLSGNGFANQIVGNNGANVLNGGGGADLLYGYNGNDTYFVDNAGDRVVEAVGQGTDRIFSAVSYTLGAGVHVEQLWTTNSGGTQAINLTGNEFANQIVGNNGANVLNGGGGADLLYGYNGNDTYFVDNAADRVVEAVGQGTDRVFSSVSYTLGVGVHVEQLWAISSAATTAMNLTGNELANQIVGNNGVNRIAGGGGNDVLYGYAGNDRLTGGAGDDTLNGGVGTDSAVFSSTRAGYVITKSGATATVDWTGAGAGDGTDTLTAIEFLVFTDQTVNLLTF